MSEDTNNQVVEVNSISLPNLEDLKQSQELVVKESPFIEIVDNESYKWAKVNRRNLVTARTTVEKGDKAIATKVKAFRTRTMEINNSLISITKPHEEKQDAEIKRWEERKAFEKAEKERVQEEKRQEALKVISDIFIPFLLDVENLVFDNITACTQNINRSLKEIELDSNFGVNEVVYNSKKDHLLSLLESKSNTLKLQEYQRVENERLAKERAKIEEEQRKLKEDRDRIEKAERQRLAKIEDERLKAQRIENERLKEVAKAKKVEEDKIEAEREKLRKEREAFEADKLAKQQAELKVKQELEEKARIKKEKIAEEKRQKALMPDKMKIKNGLEGVQYMLESELKEVDAIELSKTFANRLESLKDSFFVELQKL